MINQYKISVKGTVQGVGFRYYTKQKAVELGVLGTVQNLADGSVVIYAQGEETPINAFLDWCHNGPSTSTVKMLDYKSIPLGSYDNFKIIR